MKKVFEFTGYPDAMKPKLRNRFMRQKSVEAIRDDVNRLKPKREDDSRMADLATQAMELKQELRGALDY